MNPEQRAYWTAQDDKLAWKKKKNLCSKQWGKTEDDFEKLKIRFKKAQQKASLPSDKIAKVEKEFKKLSVACPNSVLV